MKRANCAFSLVLLLICTLASVASAEDGFELSDLNPFKKDDQRVNARVSDEDDQGFLPSFNLLPERDPGEPTLLEKMGDGTRSAFAKTKSTLMPWSEPEQKRKPVTGSRRTYSGSRQDRRKEEKTGFFNFSSWFAPEEPEREIETVNDFLSLPRPGSEF